MLWESKAQEVVELVGMTAGVQEKRGEFLFWERAGAVLEVVRASGRRVRPRIDLQTEGCMSNLSMAEWLVSAIISVPQGFKTITWIAFERRL